MASKPKVRLNLEVQEQTARYAREDSVKLNKHIGAMCDKVLLWFFTTNDAVARKQFFKAVPVKRMGRPI